jgi:PAS domain S-box-containing protein
MTQWNTLFSLEYHPKLLELFARLTPFGSLFGNVINPVIVIYLLIGSIPDIQLAVWFFLNFLIFTSRIYLAQKLRQHASQTRQQTALYIKFTLATTTISGLLHGQIIWAAVLSGADDLHIFIITLAIVALTTGAVSTLVSLFVPYLSYVLVAMTLLIAAIMYHGGDLFIIFAFLLLFVTVSITVSSYRQFILLRDTIALEETFKTVFDKSADGIMIMQNNRFTDCNEAFVRMFRFPSKQELLDLGPVAIMPKYQADGSHSIEKMRAMIRRAQHEGSSSFEWLHHRFDGEEFWAEIVLTKIYLHDTKVLHGTWRDISERKLLENERKKSQEKIESLNKTLERRVANEVKKNREMDHRLLQQSRLAQMGEMISMIAHQWRQPLSAISVTSGALSRKAKKQTLDFETSIELSDKISGYAQHLSETINDFRNFFKPNTGKGEISYDEIVQAVLEIIGVSIANKNIEIRQNLQCHVAFPCYPNELKQVLLNLLKNAEDALIEHAPDRPCIKISTYEHQGKYLLEVEDNGGGIAAKDMKYIFDPYFSTKQDKNGTGLGLYMSKTIVEEHCNGELRTKNGSEGALFTVVLGS